MELKAGAESGWDFSSRWYIDGDGNNIGTLSETRTSQFLPSDLNALMCLNEKTLASFHMILGESMRFADGKLNTREVCYLLCTTCISLSGVVQSSVCFDRIA